MAAVQNQYLTSGQVAKIMGVSTDTLRHYERLGVLQKPPRSRAKYRLYRPETVNRVRLIRNALAIGFSLAELAEILRVRDRGGAPCREVRALLEQKAAELDDRIEGLQQLSTQLRRILSDWDERLRATSPGARAGLLESISGLPIPPAKRRPGGYPR